MLRSALAALLLTALLAMPALADGPRDARQERRQEAMQRWDRLNDTQQQRGLERAEAHGLFARLTYNAGSGQATGAFLRMDVQPSAGALSGVRVRANRTLALTPLLASVTPSAFTLEDGPTVHGATLQLDGAGVDLVAHNNPTAGLTWRASAGVTLTFTLAPGLHALFPLATDAHEVRIPVGTTHAHIVSDASAPIVLSNDNTTVTVQLGAGDAAALRVHPAGDAAGSGLHDLLAAFKAHKLGATLRVADADGAAVEDGEGADVQAATRSIARGHVVWDIASAQHAGRILFLTLENGTLDLARLDQVAASLNGTGMAHLATAKEVIDSTAANGAFALVASADHQSVTIAVSVPHFSSYALALTQAAGGSGGATGTTAAGSTAASGSQAGTGSSTARTPGLEAGLLAALGLALLLRRRA